MLRRMKFIRTQNWQLEIHPKVGPTVIIDSMKRLLSLLVLGAMRPCAGSEAGIRALFELIPGKPPTPEEKNR
jgi:hypothetical protein